MLPLAFRYPLNTLFCFSLCYGIPLSEWNPLKADYPEHWPKQHICKKQYHPELWLLLNSTKNDCGYPYGKVVFHMFTARAPDKNVLRQRLSLFDGKHHNGDHLACDILLGFYAPFAFRTIHRFRFVKNFDPIHAKIRSIRQKIFRNFISVEIISG